MANYGVEFMQPTERSIGTSSLRVGPISYGCWRFAGTTVDDAAAKINAALDHNMTLIDTADIYGSRGPDGFGSSEALLGEVLRASPGLRDRCVIATKGGIRPGTPYDSTRAYLLAACDDSLRRLGIDTIDLYQIHRPDLATHPAEVAATLGELVETGKVRYVGVSNYNSAQLDALLAHAEIPIVSSQPEFSLWFHEPIDDGTLDRAMQHRLTPLAWSPLGRGAVGDATSPLGTLLCELATEYDTTPTAIALAWIMAHPSAPIPIIGTQQVERIAEAATATSVALSRADWYRLLATAGRALP